MSQLTLFSTPSKPKRDPIHNAPIVSSIASLQQDKQRDAKILQSYLREINGAKNEKIHK